MTLLKPVTSMKTASADVFYGLEVTEVTAEVTNKSIDRDIIYSIVTSVTSVFVHAYARARAQARISFFRGNRGNREKNTHAEVEKSVTSVVTQLPLKPKSYLIPQVTYVNPLRGYNYE